MHNSESAAFSLENRLKPILKWAGGKSSILPQLFPYFPLNFSRYIEPFLGGASVFLSLASQKAAVINDSNEELFNLYSVIRDNPLELGKKLDLYTKKYSENFFYELREKKLKDIEQAARTIFLNKTCFNGLYRKNLSGKFNVPFGKRLKCPSLYNLENILNVSEKLKSSNLLNKDFADILSIAKKNDLIYCDPPYEPLSSTSSFNNYSGNGFAQSEQIRLRDACISATKKGAFVAISNSVAPFILDIYKDFEIHKLLSKRSINSNGSKRGEIEEVLIIMRP